MLEISRQVWKEHVPTWERKTLFQIREIIDAELRKRALDKEAHTDYLYEGWRGFANFMYGVAQAMACRAALRWSKDHEPYGKRPMHGACWSQNEVYTANLRIVDELRLIGINSSSNPLFNWAKSDAIERLWFTKEEVKNRWSWYYDNLFIF